MQEKARKAQMENFATAYKSVAEGLTSEEGDLYQKLRNKQEQVYEEFRSQEAYRPKLSNTGNQTPAKIAAKAAYFVAASFSDKTFHERFDDQPMAESWTISDALATWYALGYFCFLSCAGLVDADPTFETAILDKGLERLIEEWQMPQQIHAKFHAFLRGNIRDILATYEGADDAQKFARFFSLFVTRIVGGTTVFSTASLSHGSLLSSVIKGEMINTDVVMHIGLSMVFVGTRSAVKKGIQSAVT